MAGNPDMGSIGSCRICDVLIAGVVIALSLPLAAAVALAIKADSCGPVLSRRVRICSNGRWVHTFKFRTAANYNRGVTRVHQFLRWTRIDTLPEVISVLGGDLTFTGTDRPGFLV
jgi:lipopolysaccharide/colanic/teichoic acid biosynthesis glycosyltransferase